MTEGGDEGPADVFDLLGDETRLAILEVLAQPRRENWQWQGLGFAELRRAVGERDAGNFSYHLDRLRGSFVVKDGEEYVLRNNGMELAGSLAAGAYAPPERELEAETDVECPYPDCERSLLAVYGESTFQLCCPAHGPFWAASLPPAAVREDPAALVEIATLRTRQEFARARAGVCPHCWGEMDATLPAEGVAVPESYGEEMPPDAVMVGFECRRCGMELTTPPGLCVLDHPAVVSLYHEHGVDVRDRPLVEFPFIEVTAATVEDGDSTRVRVDVPVDEDRLALWLDGEATVVEYERG
ncbi:MAG: winged helix-turn-helix domain-containing protein [Haloarculaceae archaeon]